MRLHPKVKPNEPLFPSAPSRCVFGQRAEGSNSHRKLAPISRMVAVINIHVVHSYLDKDCGDGVGQFGETGEGNCAML